MIRKVEPLLTGGAFDGALSLNSRDGTEVYLFDGDGRHLATVGRNGEPRLIFSYDSDGRLVGIRDADGNVTTIERSAEGAPLAIVAPGGQRTQLAIDTNGFLGTVRNHGAVVTPAEASLHSAGFAVDVNYRNRTRQEQGLIRHAARQAGLSWGGTFRDPDDVHFFIDPTNGNKRARKNLIDQAQQQVQGGGVCGCD